MLRQPRATSPYMGMCRTLVGPPLHVNLRSSHKRSSCRKRVKKRKKNYRSKVKMCPASERGESFFFFFCMFFRPFFFLFLSEILFSFGHPSCIRRACVVRDLVFRNGLVHVIINFLFRFCLFFSSLCCLYCSFYLFLFFMLVSPLICAFENAS